MHIQRYTHTSTHVQSAHKRNGDNQAQEPGWKRWKKGFVRDLAHTQTQKKNDLFWFKLLSLMETVVLNPWLRGYVLTSMWIWVDMFSAGIKPGTLRITKVLAALSTTELWCRMNHRKSFRTIFFFIFFWCQKQNRYSRIYKKRFEHIELPAKLLDYFLRSNKSNINQPRHKSSKIEGSGPLLMSHSIQFHSVWFHFSIVSKRETVYSTTLHNMSYQMGTCSKSSPVLCRCLIWFPGKIRKNSHKIAKKST